ncbi:glycosyltransferase [Halovivax sp.]|uniref:glycosyltransferase family 2 protein n=1 Tax=Halovivax sp. TaxID=1935978 RepID=UPI0025BF0726|nr:glycosyltransferase family A protein [Halovivax sp.]
MDRPLVSAIVPTRDRPERLRRAISSVEAQTYDPVELVVVDDRSTPPVADALGGREPDVDRFELVRLEENRGGAGARNAGIEAASGEILTFLDDDDRWDPAKLERQIPALLESPDDVGLVYTGVVQLDAAGGPNAITATAVDGDATKRLLVRNVVGTISSVAVRREVIDEVGPLDERFPSWQDWEFYVRVSDAFRLRAIEEPLVVRHNAGEGQLSHDYETKRDATVSLFRRKYAPLAARYGPAFEREFEAHLEYHLGLTATRCGAYGAARRHFLRAIRRYPFAPSFYLELAAVAGGRATYVPLDRLQPHLPLRAAKRALR